MMLHIILSLIHLSYCRDIIYNHKNKENNLYFVFTTFRHGARKPLNKIDFFGNHNYSAGALTEYGKIQHLEIGRKYRKRYSHFMNIKFDKNEIYIRSSNIRRTIVSTEKELEGFFNKTISKSYFSIVKDKYSMNLYHLDSKKQKEIKQYLESCPKRNLAKNYINFYNNEIFPNIKKCDQMENITHTGISMFCDSMFSHYFDYSYGNETNNILARCSKENIQKFYDFCVELYDSSKGWNELGAYMFYMLFQHIFQYMDNYINGRSKIRMMMIGGHDVTLSPLMNFLDGLNIIPRTHYPHYGCNVVIELRKYGQDFYLEFYYNDVLKYNNTLEKFKSILDNTKYSNLYNYCGIPSYLNNIIKNATNQTINNKTVKNKTKIENVKNETIKTKNNQTVKNEKKIENIKNKTINIINNQTVKNETRIENVKNKNNPTVNTQAEESIGNATQKESQAIRNFTKEKETKKVEIIGKNKNKNLLYNNDSLVKENETSRENHGKNFNFILKSFNYLAQQDMNFYVIVICTFLVIIVLIAIAILVSIWSKNRKKRYKKNKKAVAQKENPNNISIIALNDSMVKI